MENQIKENMNAAFYNIIKHAINNNDFDYIVRLYKEIRDRLAQMLFNKNGNAYKALLEDFDIQFFEQRLRNNAFDSHSMQSLVVKTFSWIHRLQMPIRETESEQAKIRVLQNVTSMDEMVPNYIREVHGCIDTMEQDMKEFYENQNHPVVKEMLRKAVEHIQSQKK